MSRSPAPSLARPTPLRPAAVRLIARDLERLSDFYRRVLGLHVLDQGPAWARLGTGGGALVHLETRPGLGAPDRRAAGLFHSAFLLPDRATLGSWLAHGARMRALIVGASDHIVSEAIYLTDPEGNGVEVYSDRPPGRWRGTDGAIEMSTGPLDLNSLLQGAGSAWSGFPPAGTLGHVHLQVGDLARADRFWTGVMGFGLTTRYPGASFYATGGYHHHIAANIWNSCGAGPRPQDAPGLAGVELIATSSAHLDQIERRARADGLAPRREGGALVLCDPWGIEIRLMEEARDAD